jgi:hypothetical protein
VRYRNWREENARIRKRRPRAPFSTASNERYFFGAGAIAGAIAGAAGAAGAAACVSPPIFVVFPALMIATGSTLPLFIL